MIPSKFRDSQVQINTIRKKYPSLPLSYDVPPSTIKKSHSSDGRDSKVDNKHQPLANGKILSKPTSHYSNIYSGNIIKTVADIYPI